MNDRAKLAREIAARTKPRFIDTTAATRDLKALAREIAARTPTRCVTIHRHRGGSPVLTEEELTARRGGLRAEEYRWKTIRKWGKSQKQR
jgi:hypothetical protein